VVEWIEKEWSSAPKQSSTARQHFCIERCPPMASSET